MQSEPIEDHFGLRNDRRFGHPTVEADTQTDQAGEHEQIRREPAEDGEEENGFDEEGGEQIGISATVGRIAEL